MKQKQIDKFFSILANELKTPSRAIITGAAAGLIWGNVRPSMDIDFQLNFLKKKEWDKVDQAVQKAVQKTNLQANYSEDIDRWGMISLIDYEKHVLKYKKFKSLQVLVMDPVYWSIGKITRYLDADRVDVASVFEKTKPSFKRVKKIWNLALRKSPQSLAKHTFSKNRDNFLILHSQDIWGKKLK